MAFFSPDKDRVLTVSHDGTARVWDVRSQRNLPIISTVIPLKMASFNPDGTRIAIANTQGAQILDARTGKVLARSRQVCSATTIVFNPGGKKFLTTDDSTIIGDIKYRKGDGKWRTLKSKGVACICDSKTGEVLARLRHEHTVIAAAFSSDGQKVVTGSADNTVRVWNVRTGQQLVLLRNVENVAFTTFGPHGRLILTITEGGVVRMWDARSYKKLTEFSPYKSVLSDFLALPQNLWAKAIAFPAARSAQHPTVQGRSPKIRRAIMAWGAVCPSPSSG